MPARSDRRPINAPRELQQGRHRPCCRQRGCDRRGRSPPATTWQSARDPATATGHMKKASFLVVLAARLMCTREPRHSCPTVPWTPLCEEKSELTSTVASIALLPCNEASAACKPLLEVRPQTRCGAAPQRCREPGSCSPRPRTDGRLVPVKPDLHAEVRK